jgi:hypothetical protein
MVESKQEMIEEFLPIEIPKVINNKYRFIKSLEKSEVVINCIYEDIKSEEKVLVRSFGDKFAGTARVEKKFFKDMKEKLSFIPTYIDDQTLFRRISIVFKFYE